MILVSGAPNFVIPVCTLVQLVLCGTWLVISPLLIDTDTSEHGYINSGTEDMIEEIYSSIKKY